MTYVSEADQNRLIELAEEAKKILMPYSCFENHEKAPSTICRANSAINNFSKWVELINYDVNKF